MKRTNATLSCLTERIYALIAGIGPSNRGTFLSIRRSAWHLSMASIDIGGEPLPMSFHRIHLMTLLDFASM